MLSESWLNGAFLLSFCQSTHRDKGCLRRRLVMIKTKNQMTLIAIVYRLKIAQKNLNMNLNIHVNIEPQKFW